MEGPSLHWSTTSISRRERLYVVTRGERRGVEMPRVPSPTQCVCPRVSHTVCPSHMFGQMGPGLGGKMHNLTENIKWGGNLRTETRIEAPQSENTKTQKIRIWFWLCNLAH